VVFGTLCGEHSAATKYAKVPLVTYMYNVQNTVVFLISVLKTGSLLKLIFQFADHVYIVVLSVEHDKHSNL
jgi:hypothetical protein